MAVPTITYDASGGSDTAKSGAPAAMTAVTGTNGDIASTTLTLNETKDFTGVADDDTDVLYYAGNAGDRHLFTITAFNGGVSTCTSLTLAETCTGSRSGKSWAVGGKRKTFKNDTSRYDWADWAAGWTVVLETGTYDSGTSIVCPAGTVAAGWFTMKAAASASPVLDNAAASNYRTLTIANLVRLVGLKITTQSTWVGADCVYLSGSTEAYQLISCELAGKGKNASGFNMNSSVCSAAVIDCYIHDCLYGVYLPTGRPQATIRGNYITGNTDGIRVATGTGLAGVCIVNNIITSNSGNGVMVSTANTDQITIVGNTFYANGDGVELATATLQKIYIITDNIFSENTAYGINGTSNSNSCVYLNYNAYYANATAALNNLTAGASDVTLTADPFSSKAGGNFALNSTAGGGAACVGVGSPQTPKSASTDCNFNIGAAQNGSSSGGNVIVIED